jgi:integrase/recombinase XerD
MQRARDISLYLVTALRRPFTPAGFGNWFRDQCDQANLHHCSAHGLRKACATALAEAGATAHEIAAVTGHQSLEEIERYTRAAERKHLADRAMQKIKR